MRGITEMGIGELRRKLSNRIERAFHNNEPTIIRNAKRNRSEAALIPYGWLEELYARRAKDVEKAAA